MRTLRTVRLAPGDEGRRPLVLLHGFTGDAGTWGPLVEAFASEQPLMALDLPGHGRSPSWPTYDLGAVARAVAGAGRKAVGGSAHWLGYSMGGRIALRLGLDHPAVVASLVLVGASPGIADPRARQARRRADEELARFMETEGLEAFVDRWMAHPLFATQGRLGGQHAARARRQRLGNRVADLAAILRGMGPGAMEPVHEVLGTLAAPTLFVAGELDSKFRRLAVEMASSAPRARVGVVRGAGHAVHLEAPQALAELVMGFLEEEGGEDGAQHDC